MKEFFSVILHCLPGLFLMLLFIWWDGALRDVRENSKNNEFLAVNQFTIIENNRNRRPDIIIFINGLPIAIIELKNPADEKATIESAYRQLQTYKDQIQTIFNYNEILVISDGTYAQAGTLTSPQEWFLPWKTIDGKDTAPKSLPQLQVLLEGMFKKEILVDLIKYFVTFTKEKKQISKILAGYHQYYATNKAIRKTLSAIKGNGKAGIVWHTQGSGKSLTLAFYSGKLQQQEEFNNPTLVILSCFVSHINFSTISCCPSEWRCICNTRRRN